MRIPIGVIEIRSDGHRSFCPTGEGGGVDPSCSHGGGASSTSPHGWTEHDSELMQSWLYPDAGGGYDYSKMRNPKTKEGKETTEMLNKAPEYDGVSYRGLALEDKDVGQFLGAKEIKMKLHSSASKDEDVAKGFMESEHSGQPGTTPFLLELRGRAADISSFEQTHSEYDNKEVVSKAGTVYRFRGLHRESGFTRIVLEEKR